LRTIDLGLRREVSQGADSEVAGKLRKIHVPQNKKEEN
jgi:hypothetical protein